MTANPASVDVWLRGEVHATTHPLPIDHVNAASWSDAEVASLLVGMLRVMHLTKDPTADPNQPIALRGFSWIVNPYESGGVVVAIEMQLGAAVAGPFHASESDLSAKIQRVLETERRSSGAGGTSGQTVH
jgi:hypothetical protein